LNTTFIIARSRFFCLTGDSVNRTFSKSHAAFLLLLFSSAALRAAPSALDLLGKWEGAVTFGKMKFVLVLRLATNEMGQLKTTIDLPDQGQKGMPANALLFNPPDIRLEIDGFGTAYNGKVNAELTEIVGEFEEGPGGRPERLDFKRSTQPDLPEPERTFTFAAGEAPDIRGYWKGEIDAAPDLKLVAGLNIGRLADGSFRATLDLPEQGARNVPASSVQATNGGAVIQWQGFLSEFQGKLSQDGQALSGTWAQRGRTNAIAFSRISAPVQLLPTNLSFDPDAANADDPRGEWKGVLQIPQGKLRLIFRIGRTPEGTFAGTLLSPDQGGAELPSSSASFSAPALKMEWKAIRGKFEGTLSKDGKTLEGQWEQFGGGLPLKLERSATTTNSKS
jgi:hypothetical protein